MVSNKRQITKYLLKKTTMGCGCKKKKEATLSEPIKQPTQGVAQTNVNETNNLNDRNQKQIVDAILEKLKQINN